MWLRIPILAVVPEFMPTTPVSSQSQSQSQIEGPKVSMGQLRQEKLVTDEGGFVPPVYDEGSLE